MLARALQLQGSGFIESFDFEDMENILKTKYLGEAGRGIKQEIITSGTRTCIFVFFLRTCIFKDSNNIEYGLKSKYLEIFWTPSPGVFD